jgi:hypothetical protein
MLTSYGQTITVTPFSLDQDLRVLQLQGKLPLENSMNLRPISFNKKFTADSLYQRIGGDMKNNFKEAKVDFWKGNGKITLLPFSSITKYTSHHPYGWSDGALMPVNGLQQIISGGVYAELGPLSLQIKPEVLYAQNNPYETTIHYGQVTLGGKVNKVFPGQSRAALNIGPLSFAASTENIWWGPGQSTGLMMTNNPSGFFHLSFNTRKPLKTPIGSFEWQVIGGKLTGNDTKFEEVYNFKSYNQWYNITNNDIDFSKYTNAMMFTYNPSFLKGVSVGGTRSFISGAGDVISRISKKVGIVKAFLPIFDGLFKENRIAFEDSLEWNQLVSLFVRSVVPKANAEIYVEYGWNDHKFNVRDLMMSPAHSNSYLIGVKKIFEIKKNAYIDFTAEYNQLAQSSDRLVRDAGSWYIHGNKSHFSQRGEILGSGVGYGSNLLTLSAVLRKGFDQLGLITERVERDPTEFEQRWTDMSIGLIGRKKINSFLLNTRLSGIVSKNYGWENGKNRFNFMGMMGISYFF